MTELYKHQASFTFCFVGKVFYHLSSKAFNLHAHTSM